MSEFVIRNATINDAQGIIDVYRPYVEKTTHTLAMTVPDQTKIQTLIAKAKASILPFIVYELDGEIIAYAFASRFQEKRQAYKYTCIANIYVDSAYHGGNVSHQLYNELENRLIQAGIVQVYSNITGTNISAQIFHQQHGFVTVGQMPKFGFKFDQWHDIIWMAKTIQ